MLRCVSVNTGREPDRKKKKNHTKKFRLVLCSQDVSFPNRIWDQREKICII